MPSINALYEEFRGRGLRVLLVNMGEDPELVRRAVKTHGYSAPVVLDVDRQVVRDYGVTGTPTVYLIDRQQHLLARAVGRREWASEPGRRLLAAVLMR